MIYNDKILSASTNVLIDILIEVYWCRSLIHFIIFENDPLIFSVPSKIIIFLYHYLDRYKSFLQEY